MLPICALCLSLSAREMDFDQPMFEDVPREHPRVYMQVIKNSKASALCVAVLAFASGLARGVAAINPQTSDVVNFASMAGLLLAAATLLALWLTSSVRFGLRTVFRGVYSIIITGPFLFPFMQKVGPSLFAGLTYMAFSLVTLIMMMQCAQTSRDRGTNPVFAYGFFGSAAHIAQGFGFLLGWFANDIKILGVGKPDSNEDPENTDGNAADIRIDANSTSKKAPMRKQEQGTTTNPQSARRFEGTDHVITDRLSKQCIVVRERHGLSSRETEIMELFARDKSMASIAEELFISENAVRTHCKHIYSKLDIHSRQELSDPVSNTKL